MNKVLIIKSDVAAQFHVDGQVPKVEFAKSQRATAAVQTYPSESLGGARTFMISCLLC